MRQQWLFAFKRKKTHTELLELLKFLKATEEYEDTMTNVYNQSMHVTDVDSWCFLHNLNLLQTIFLRQNIIKFLKNGLEFEIFLPQSLYRQGFKIILGFLEYNFFHSLHCNAVC